MGARNLAHSNFLQSEGKNQRSRSGADEITGPTNPAQDPADCFSAILGGDGFHRETTYISPTRRNIETVFQLSLPPERIFRHIRWAETNFKTFLLSPPPSNLNLSLAVTDPSRFFPFESRITNLSFFLSSFFYFLQGATLQGKTRLNRGAEGMDDNRFRFPVEFVSMSCLREG